MSIDFLKLKKEIVDQHNLARTNPKSYIPILKKYITYFKGNILNKPQNDFGIETEEGTAPYKECIEFLTKQQPVCELTLDSFLSKAAQYHVDDIGPQGICSHDGTNGSTASSRIEKYIDWDITCCENIDFGATTGEEILVSLLVDDGVSDRGHRKNIFNPKIKYIGVGVGPHAEFGVCSVMDYIGGIGAYLDCKKEAAKNVGMLKDAIKSKSKTTTTNNSNNNPITDKWSSNISTTNQKNQTQTAAATAGGKKESNIKNSVDLTKDAFNKINLNSKSKKEVIIDNPFKDDPDAPENAVAISIKTVTKKIGGKTIKKVTKTYKLEDGSEEIVELEEIS